MDDFPHYAETCLQIRPKKGGLVPLVLNRVQKFIHEQLEDQLARTGRIRALILKARQPGCSTYVEGRYYWQVTHRKGVRAFILTHKQDATDNLFTMTERFHINCPALVKPHTGKSNAKELVFDHLDSGYRVGTAGTAGVGRSDTIQFFHGSEVAFWQHADDHMTGAMQAIPGEDGTEVILESTADGLGGLFYSMCKAAERGESEYILIFIPWYWHHEYTEEPPEGWRAPDKIIEYGKLHDLTPGQVYWCYQKNRALAQSINAEATEICWKFRQEYPGTSEEAFQTGAGESFIKSEHVYRARKNKIDANPRSPIIMGVDIARGGGDKTRIVDRQGRKAGGNVYREIDSDDLMVVAGLVAQEIDRVSPKKCFVDVTGLGAGVYDRLVEMSYRMVEGINFGESPIDDDQYFNKRAEMWGEMAEWYKDPAGVDVPDDDELHTDMCAPVWGKGATKFNSKSQIVLESKEHIKERLGLSPDIGDALALTFAAPVHVDRDHQGETEDRYERASRRARRRGTKGKGSWMAQ